jgi:hypothetical protein
MSVTHPCNSSPHTPSGSLPTTLAPPGEVKASTLQNFTRDFPISHDIMVENTSDQSHVGHRGLLAVNFFAVAFEADFSVGYVW